MTDTHGLSVLKEELKQEKDRLYSYAEDIDYHTRMLSEAKYKHSESKRHIEDLEETIKSLEG